MSLDSIREQIDALDTELLKLLNERADLVHQVGEIKKKDGIEIYAPEREESLLKRLAEKSEGRLTEDSIRAIYREIMSAALSLEEDLKIAYLGPQGTWTHQAAISKFGHSVSYSAQESLSAVFDQVARKKADYGVVPIENSTEGAVNHTLDMFADSPLRICSQILLPIENALMASISREDIKKLYSHPQVFGQCREWIQENFPNADLIEVSSTTRAAAIVVNEPEAAALGGKLAAELNGLELLEESIQDRATNTTRFLVLSHNMCPPTGSDRTSVMFSVRDKPGSLFDALQPFNAFKINMSKIESRPSKQRDWEYYFFVDIVGHCKDPDLAQALGELEEHCSFIKILGSYPDSAAI